MSALRLRAIGLTLLALYVLALNWATTQYIADAFAYHGGLGTPLFGHVYAPFDWFGWQKFYASAPHPFNVAYILFLAGMGLGFILYVLAIGFRTRSPVKHDGLHGTAHWASEEEIRASGLLPHENRPGKGVYVGGWTDADGHLRYLRHDGPEHCCAIAPTRSGKGVGLVVPTLLSWPHSLIVNDQKGELWNLTAGWRKESGNIVLKFDPAALEGTVAFNPLDEVRIGTPHEVGDVQNLATMIVDPDGKGLTDHWTKTSWSFLTSLILHLKYKAIGQARQPGLGDVAASISDPSRPTDALYQEMLNNRHLNGELHPVVASGARDMLDRYESERTGVLSTTKSFLSLYRDPVIAGNVSRSDFRIADLMNSDRPVTLYLTVRAEDKDRMRPLMRLIINQLVRVLLRPELKFENGRQLPPHKHRLCILLDEFPSYGRLDVFQEALAYIAGYGIKAYLIMQDIEQLYSTYTKHETIISNCHVRVAYAPNKIETGDWISRNTGVKTEITEEISTSGHRFGAFLQSVSRTFRAVSRPLLTPDEAMRLKGPVKNVHDQIVEPGEVVTFVAGHAPIRGTQSLFFRDPVFSRRASISAPSTDRVVRQNETASRKEFVL